MFARMSRADEQLFSPDITNDGEFLHLIHCVGYHKILVLGMLDTCHIYLIICLLIINSSNYNSSSFSI